MAPRGAEKLKRGRPEKNVRGAQGQNLKQQGPGCRSRPESLRARGGGGERKLDTSFPVKYTKFTKGVHVNTHQADSGLLGFSGPR